MIMPCGTGKSLTAFWIARRLRARSILVAVPSLALIRQSLTDWTREFLAHGEVPDWLCVCSDETTGRLERDEFVGEVYELGVDATTDPAEIARFLAARNGRRRIVFTTYQSSAVLAKAARKARFRFDLGSMDEAHRTVGSQEKAFAQLLFDKNVGIKRRLFMTATERVVHGAYDEVVSMDDPKVYGERFYQLSFKARLRHVRQSSLTTRSSRSPSPTLLSAT
jgi:predicted helicase